MFQFSASMGKESVVGPFRLLESMGVSTIPDQLQQAFNFAISPDGTVLGEIDVAYMTLRAYGEILRLTF